MLETIIHNLDLFKTPFTLHFQKRKSVTTSIGTLLSCGILIIIIYFATQSDLFARLSPQILDSTMGLDFRPLIRFNQKLISVGVHYETNDTGYIDPTIYSLLVYNFFYHTNDSSGNGYRNEQVIKNLHICTETDFQENRSIFASLNYKNNFCFDDNNFELEGYWNEPGISYATFQLILCNNETMNNTCKSYEEIVKTLNGKIFSLSYYDTVVDTSNYKEPIKHVISKEWTYIDISIRKETEYFFENIELKTDDGFLFHSTSYFNDIQYLTKNTDFNFAAENDLTTPRITFSFLSEKKQRHIVRIYQKISDLLASMGGILNSLIIIGFIWVRYEQSFFIKKHILNSLYSFKIKTKKQKKKRKKELLSRLRAAGKDTLIGINKVSTQNAFKDQIKIKPEENFIESKVKIKELIEKQRNQQT